MFKIFLENLLCRLENEYKAWEVEVTETNSGVKIKLYREHLEGNEILIELDKDFNIEVSPNYSLNSSMFKQDIYFKYRWALRDAADEMIAKAEDEIYN